MAFTYTKAVVDLTTTAETIVYTVPGSTKAIIASIHLYNYHGSSTAITTISIKDSGSTEYEITDVTLLAGEDTNAITRRIHLDATDTLVLQSDVATAIRAVVSIIQDA